MKNFTKKTALLLLIIFSIASTKIKAADIISAATGNWSSAATWVGGFVPGAGDNVFIATGHTITVDGNFAITDLNLSIEGGGTRLILNSGFTLQLNGKLRAFTNTPNPNTSSPSPTVNLIQSQTPILTGKIQFVGATRNLTVNGEWGSSPRSYVVDIALNTGAIGTFQTGFKAGDITISSGIAVANADLKASYNADNTGSITVKNTATLRLANDVNVSQVATPSATTQLASFTVDAGGTLEYSGSTVGYIDAQNISLLGLIYYSNSTNPQTLVNKPAAPADGAIPNVYNDVTFLATAKTLSTNITVNGILSMRANASTPSLVLGGNTLTYGSTATLQYRGASTAPQTTADAEWPASGSTPPNVDIFNPNGVTLHANRTISNNLKITGTGSKFILGANNMVANSVTIGGTDDGTKYVVTNGLGSLTINNIGAAAVKFPVGPSTTLYHPATITNNGTVDNFSVKVSSTNPPCANALYTVNATWDISETVAGGSNCALTLDYNGATGIGANYDVNIAKIAHCIGGISDYHNGSVTGTVASGAGFTTFSPFAITSDPVVLPISLVYFNAKKINKDVQLQWATSFEQNNKGFEVLRSTNGINFSKIAFVNSNTSNGNSNSRLNYSFIDFNDKEGTFFYRLNQVDNNLRSRLSDIVTVNGTATDKFTVTNLLVNQNNLSVTVASPSNQQITCFIYDASGKLITSDKRNIQVGANTITLPIGNLQSGMYYCSIVSASEKITKNFIK